MSIFLLSVHVVTAIVFVGPVTVAASMFPPLARAVVDGEQAPDPGRVAVLATLHRISRTYAVLAIAVPVFGVATALQLGVLTDGWVVVSAALTIVAGVLLAVAIVPRQGAIVRSAQEGRAAGDTALRQTARRLSMTTGIFALTWTVVVVLMIARPGSTTGV